MTTRGFPALDRAVAAAGSQLRLAAMLGVRYQTIQKWRAMGRLPRTEWTGETDYAERIAIATGGKVTSRELLAKTRTRKK